MHMASTPSSTSTLSPSSALSPATAKYNYKTDNKCIFDFNYKGGPPIDDRACSVGDTTCIDAIECILSPGVVTLLITFLATGLVIYLTWLFFKAKTARLHRLRKITHFLTSEEIIELQVHAPQFSETLLRNMFIRFMNLDDDRSGTLTCQEFCSMPELSCNPLAYRLFDAFDVNEDGHLDFAEFIGCIYVMSPLCPANEKANAMFRIYDVDSDGKINREDLKYILGCVTHRPKSTIELTVGVNVHETLDEHMEKEREWDTFIGSIVDEVMTTSASDPDDQFMTLDDFMQALATTQADFREKMNIPFRESN